LIAHGRGEAFDYLLGEVSHPFALEAEKAAVCLLILADHPIISVNGNCAALVSEDIAKLSNLLDIPLEVNLFHRTDARVEKIENHLKNSGAGRIYARGDAILEDLDHDRRVVDSRGIYRADVVFVPLEDGDRCEVLKIHGKKVITVDLNPLSRTARAADITIVDNIVRAIPNMIKMVNELKTADKSELDGVLARYDNRRVLSYALETINENLNRISRELLE
jgi:4-phosphopantoate--beta-alanine ligase